MFSYSRYMMVTFILLLVGYMSWRTYQYFFDKTAPEIMLVGIEQNGYYTGDIQAVVQGKSPYKIATLSIKIDDVIIVKDIKINKRKVSYPLMITKGQFSDGLHTIKINMIDGTKHKNSMELDRSFYMDNLPLQATLVNTGNDYRVLQGRCFWVQFQVNKPIAHAVLKTMSSDFVCYPKNKNGLIYECFVPIDCEQVAQEYPFAIEIKDHIGNKLVIEDVFYVVAASFRRVILNVPNDKLKSELEFTPLQERDLEEALDKLTKQSVQEKLWYGPFEVPIAMTKIVSEFGVIRTSQERGRTVHKALDIIGPLKGVVWASQSGIVVLKERYNHSGNTVVIDHGYGILSLYFHLNDFGDVGVGQKVRKGYPLGHMGMTGFANGHHLHWEIRVNNMPVEPMQWTQFS